MGLSMLFEIVVGGMGRFAMDQGCRALFAQNSDVVDLAIVDTCHQYDDIVVKPALQSWISSDAFEAIFDGLKSGKRDFDDEMIVSSFLDVGDLYLPGEPLRDIAKQIVSTFLSALANRLLLSDQAIPLLANRQEQLHSDTREHFSQELAQVKAMIDALPTSLIVGLEESSDTQTPINPQHATLTAQLDSARDLINAGKVKSARALLEMLLDNAGDIPSNLEFRLLTNLGICVLAADDIEEGCAYLERAYRLQPNAAKSLVNAALVARLNNDPSRAIELTSQALKLEPRDSYAASELMAALWDAGETKRLDEFVSNEDWVVDDRPCATLLARIRADQLRFDEAVALSRCLVQDEEADYDEHLVLAGILLQASDARQGGDVLAFYLEAVEQATQALDLLEATELQVRRSLAQSIRAGARLALGAFDEAIDDVEAVLQTDPNDANALYHKGVILLKTERPEEAIAAFDRIREPHVRSKILFQFALAYRASGDEETAATLLRSEVSLECPTWDDILKAELLCEVEAFLCIEDTTAPLIELALELNPTDLKLLTLAATHQHFRGTDTDAEKILLEALSSARNEDLIEIVWRLANLYRHQGRYSEAADRFVEAIQGNVAHPGAEALLTSFWNSGRQREAFAWSRKIRVEHPHPPKFAIEIEAQILGRVGDIASSVECWESICSRDDATAVDKVQLALLQFRCGARERVLDQVRQVNAAELCSEPFVLLKLAQLKHYVGEEDWLDDAYLARRCGMNHAPIHLGYFALFVGCHKDSQSPESVEVGTAVLLRVDSDEQWWHILETGEESHTANELAQNSDLTQRLLGRQRGESVTLQEGELPHEVVDIQTKYVRALQETMLLYPTRFPNNTHLSSIPMTQDGIIKVLGLVDERDRYFLKLHEWYRDEPISFIILANSLGVPAPELWRACTGSSEIRIRFSSGSDREAQKASDLLRHADKIVLDMLALLTVHELDLRQKLLERFDQVAVPQNVIDELRQLVYEATMVVQPHGHVAKNPNGTYSLVEMSSEEWEAYQNFTRSVLSLAQSLDPITSYPELDIDGEVIEQLSELITGAGVGSIFAGGKDPDDRPLLVSDDLGQANLARAIGVDAVNTQGVLRELLRSEVLTQEEYSRFIARLAMLNYRFVQVDPMVLLTLLDVNGFQTDEGTRALFAVLEGPECTQESAVSVVAELIAQLAQKGLLQETLLVSLLLGHLYRGREATTVLRDCLKELEVKLGFIPLAQTRIRLLVMQYISLVGG